MATIFKNRRVISNFKELVASYSLTEFDSPRRSTVLLLDFWRSFGAAVKEFGKLICLDNSYQSLLHFEYTVPVQAGSGKVSQTDLMLINKNSAFALEAKYIENPYPSVANWLQISETQNRNDVLDGWLTLIHSRTGVSLAKNDISSLPYQLIHRTASACYASTTSSHILYQVFDPAKQDYYYQCLDHIADLFQEHSEVSFWLMLCPFEPLREYQKLLERWDSQSPKPQLSSDVIPILESRRLVRFHEPKLIGFKKCGTS